MMPNGEPWNGVFLFHSHTHHDIFLYSKAIVRCWKFLEALYLGGGVGRGVMLESSKQVLWVCSVYENKNNIQLKNIII